MLASLNPAIEGYELTADGNIVHASVTLRYHISDPLAYSFNFVNATNAILGVLNNALIYAATHSTVDEALVNNAGFKEKVLSRVTAQIDTMKLGITIDPSEVRVVVPGAVMPLFDAVLAAEQEKNTATQNALGQADATNQQAQAEANAVINAAEAERSGYVLAVKADASSFTNQLVQDPRESRIVSGTASGGDLAEDPGGHAQQTSGSCRTERTMTGPSCDCI